jgi:hypothetical protein
MTCSTKCQIFSLLLDGGEEEQQIAALSETVGPMAVSENRADWAAALAALVVQAPGADALTGHAHADGMYDRSSIMVMTRTHRGAGADRGRRMPV